MRLYLTALTLIATLISGCGLGSPPAAQPTPTPDPAPQQPTASDYFPYKPGMTAVYEGKGNEFASYSVQVLFQENNLVEWRRITGGTTLAEVFKVEPNQVTLVFREGEVYDQNKRLGLPSNIQEVLLEGPIANGTTWTSGDVTYTILSTTEQVDAVGTTLSDVMLVEQKHESSTIRKYYHQTYGMVLSIFQSTGATDTVESRLKTLTSQ